MKYGSQAAFIPACMKSTGHEPVLYGDWPGDVAERGRSGKETDRAVRYPLA